MDPLFLCLFRERKAFHGGASDNLEETKKFWRELIGKTTVLSSPVKTSVMFNDMGENPKIPHPKYLLFPCFPFQRRESKESFFLKKKSSQWSTLSGNGMCCRNVKKRDFSVTPISSLPRSPPSLLNKILRKKENNGFEKSSLV